MPELTDLPAVRSSERARYKRCKTAWYWSYRKGLVPRAHRFGALELGTWMHAALADWYRHQSRRDQRNIPLLKEIFSSHAKGDIYSAIQAKAPQHVIDKAEELMSLGSAMADAYQAYYGWDRQIKVIGVEVPLTFKIPHPDTGEIIAVHKFKPDAIIEWKGGIWLMEHKTATSIQTAHLSIDDQARPYGAMAERAMWNAGAIGRGKPFKGILYNFLRKALPDSRARNNKGQYLNKNGSISKKQPPPFFMRKEITMTRQEKLITLRRVQAETVEITDLTLALRSGQYKKDWLQKTPHKSCPKFCEFFDMCEAEERGTDIMNMERSMFFRRNPYLYEEENGTTTDIKSFEMG